VTDSWRTVITQTLCCERSSSSTTSSPIQTTTPSSRHCPTAPVSPTVRLTFTHRVSRERNAIGRVRQSVFTLAFFNQLGLTFGIATPPPEGQQSIVMSLSVCLSVCVSVSISGNACPVFANSLRMLPTAVALPLAVLRY